MSKNQRQPSNLKMSERLEQAFRRFPSVGENSALHTRVPQKARTTVFTQHNQLQPQGRRNPNIHWQKDDKLWYRKDAILCSKKGSKLQLHVSWINVINNTAFKVRHGEATPVTPCISSSERGRSSGCLGGSGGGCFGEECGKVTGSGHGCQLGGCSVS